MPFNFTFGGINLPQWTIEIYVGNAMTQQQTMQMPYEMMVSQFAQIVNEIANAPQPMKAICRGTREIETGFNEWKELPARVEYYNLRWDGDFDV